MRQRQAKVVNQNGRRHTVGHRQAAPLAVSDEAVRLAVIGKLGWIRRQRARFEDQPRQSKHEMVSGESHNLL